MKSSSSYVDLDDQLQAAPRPRGHGDHEQPHPSHLPAQQGASTTRPRTWATIGAGIAAAAATITTTIHAAVSPDPAAATAACAMLLTLGGIGIALLLSWIAARAAREAGFGRVEPPARDPAAKWGWSAVPLYPRLGTRYLARAMKQHPAARYRYVLSFKACGLASFAARAGLQGQYRRAIATMSGQQRAQWFGGAGGGWSASFQAGVSAAGPGTLAGARDAMRAALAGTFDGIAFAGRGHFRREVYFLGEELAPEAMVPKELAPDVAAGVAVEVHAPVAMRVDVPLGKVVEPETLDAVAEAGILHAHLDGGLVVAGGRVSERVGLLKLVLSRAQPFTPVVIDDHGDYHVPGAAVLVPGQGFTINPLLPATAAPDARAARQHASLVVSALAAVHAFTQEQEAFLATRVQEVADAAALKGLAPVPGELAAVLASDAKSAAEKAVALAVQRDVTGWSGGHVGMQDVPCLGALVQAGKPVVFDLSGVPGAEKRVLKAMLVLKAASLGAVAAPRPLLAAVPDFDKVFHDERGDRLPPRVAQAADKVANALAGSVARFVLSAQDPAKLPPQLLAHARAVVAFRQPSPQAKDAMVQALGLDDEQLYDRSRHASYQHKYLAELPPGTCFLRRPDVPSPFLVAVDMEAAGKLFPAGAAAGGGAGAAAGDPLESALLQFGLVKGDVVGLLDAMRRSGNQGVKKDWMADILAGKCQATISRRDPALPARDAEAQGRALAGRIMDVLVARGIVVEDGFNPSGLKKGVTAKMTQYGLAALGRASSAPAAATAMDPIHERVLSAERAIAEEYPNGDVAALGERLLSDMVALFQALVGAGDIEQHVDLLARSNRHAAALGEAMETRDAAAIKTALAPVINDLREVASLL